jgi:DinB superfamily
MPGSESMNIAHGSGFRPHSTGVAGYPTLLPSLFPAGAHMQRVATAFPPYDFYTTDQLLEAYREGPARLRAAIAGLSMEQLRARPRPGKWSILEIVLHVADSELSGALRVRYVRAQPGARLPMYDQDLWTARLRHNEADVGLLDDTLALFHLLRRTTGRIFAAAHGDDWSASAIHAEYGEITLRNLLELYADHGERHVEQILQSRALLRVPLELPALLPRRLY